MFLPVIFACLLNGECNFFSDAPRKAESCERLVIEYLEMAKKSGAFASATGICIPIPKEA